MNTDEALDIIQSRSGRMYDPSVIRIFLELHAAGEMNTKDPGDEGASPLRARIQKLFEVAPAAPAWALPKPTCQDSVGQFVSTLGGLDSLTSRTRFRRSCQHRCPTPSRCCSARIQRRTNS